MARLIQELAATERVGRYPKHPFMTKELPFTAQPFMIAPVLPGETLKNLYFESRVITDPILNPIVGWKKEYYFFYVPVTLLLVDEIREMFIDPLNTDISATLGLAATDGAYYTAKGGVDYLKRSVKCIIEAHFRDEGETMATAQTAAGVPIVQIRDRLWLDSLTDKDTSALTSDPSATHDSPTNLEELQALYEAYDQLRQVGVMANMTWEDFIRGYGISVPETVDEQKPELLARYSDFQYPSNAIDPTNGSPSSAVSWVFKNGKRDPKFFKEPGFVVGLSITRPKVYFGALAGNLAGHLTRAWDWLPNYLNESSPIPLPETAFKKFAADAGPLGDRATATDAYWVEMRDLFLHGDQFQNMVPFADNGTPAGNYAHHMLPLPAGNNHEQYKYPTEAMCKGFFKDAVNKVDIRQDGYCSLQIQGKVKNVQPGPITVQ
ncbi:hypothetical protein NT2_13_00580 [Caenibius tardaugens NBRC 16725]|uniref:Major capsid protein n=1 Tax=Caenibius tardaugens NBRC 16725 TaxID=1219035 RepID=U2YBS0_9SPHN|nr:hypothetical protein [Caenibius tardaugens]AZI37899.1 hypothetical protein EGO55_19625 [Caenibius tardaugens NBRC 16725]GAD50971.1 hypothetical protein NT2_13_00580 [Caenibius tardaugens NBRC 16725]